MNGFKTIACKQAYRGALAAEWEKEESLQPRLWNLNICIEKVDAKWWLAEMTLVMTSSPLTRVLQCLLTFALVPLGADRRKSDSSVDREPQENWRWNSNSRDVVASSAFFSRPATRAPQRACSQTIKIQSTLSKTYTFENGTKLSVLERYSSYWESNKGVKTERNQVKVSVNSLSPNIHMQILQKGLYTFPLRISWENLLKDQSIFSLVIILLILITFSLANVWISLGESWCWSLLGLKGLRESRLHFGFRIQSTLT